MHMTGIAGHDESIGSILPEQGGNQPPVLLKRQARLRGLSCRTAKLLIIEVNQPMAHFGLV
jgi:hypothetical protein